MPIAIFSSWESIKDREKLYYIMLMILEFGLIGVFSALDTFLFYIFWELVLIPMYFLIGIWGGKDRIYASMKFFLYTMAASLLMLVAIIWLGHYPELSGGHFTADIRKLIVLAPQIPFDVQKWMFLAFALSFCVKVPVFPLHTWLPDAHTQAPTAGSVILAGVMLKMGTYGLIRFNLQLFPQSSLYYADFISVLAVIGIIYGALLAMVQTDIKKLVAYSSVAHLGFVTLGIFSMTVEGVQGAIIQMVNHGLSTGMLFLGVGYIYERRHTREMSEFGGIATSMPVYATFFAIAVFASVGLPGLNGFVGEYLTLIGAYTSRHLSSTWFAIIAASGVILAAVYLLVLYQRIFFGPITKAENAKLKDLSPMEIGLVIPLVILFVWIGFHPNTFLRKYDS
jgi:NADH-quinone oxidoreductase subunit M